MGSYRLAPAFRWQNAVEGDIMRIRLRPVDLTVYLRLCGVLRIPAWQINARSNRHPPDANRPTLEERRCG
jgi:hypothetical protein